MNSVADYMLQANHNAELASYLRREKTTYLDWAATCLFYAAIHYVNAYLTHRDVPIPRRHRTQGGLRGRSNIISADASLKTIYRAYRHLDDESRDARYELKKPSPEDYDRYLVTQLDRIRQFAISAIPSASRIT